MREATLGGLSALDTVRPAKGPARPRGAPGAAAKRPMRTKGDFRRFRTRFALIVGSAGFSAIMIGIVLNATVMQKEHHPAPLFGGTPAPAPLRPTAPAVASTPAVVPVVAAPAPALERAAAPAPMPVPAVAPPAPRPVGHASATASHGVPPHAAAHAVPVHRADPIGQLIGHSGGADLHQRVAHAPAKATSSVQATSGKTPVMSLQRKASQPRTAASVPHRSIPVAPRAATDNGVN